MNTFSPEIISEIIGYLHDDKKTLLTLGLASKQTLYESRHYLFSTVDFFAPCSNPYVWEDFDRFLQLIDVAWTSFTTTIQHISIQRAYVFNNYADNDSTTRVIPLARIRTNLPNVKSLRLLFSEWDGLPSYIQDFIFWLPIEHLALHASEMTVMHNIFRRFPHSLRTLDFKEMRFSRIPDFSKELSTFHRPFRFKSLDSQSLPLFKSVWDPSICHNLDIRVKSFYLQSPPLHDQFWLHQREAPFIFRFLQHIGPSLENLTISLATYNRTYLPRITSLLDPIHVSRCINLHSFEIGDVELEDLDHAPGSANMTDIVLKLLSALPSPRDLREISIAVKPVAQSLEDHLAVLELFQWSSLVKTVQRLFPNLHKLAISIGIGELRDFDPFFDLLRRVANLKELEGVIKLRVFFSPPKLSRLRCGNARRKGLV